MNSRQCEGLGKSTLRSSTYASTTCASRARGEALLRSPSKALSAARIRVAMRLHKIDR